MDAEVFRTVCELHERLRAQACSLGFEWTDSGRP
jgi:hypothetical protein